MISPDLLVGPYTAVSKRPRRQWSTATPPWLHTYASSNAPLTVRGPYPRTIGTLIGSGTADDAEAAWRISAIESLERLAMCGVPRELPTVDARSMPDAIDLSQLPRCSDREMADPRCPVTGPDSAAPIRWTEGIDLFDDTPVQLPAVMIYYDLPPLPAERFWLQVSTGTAAGPTWESALGAAICEAIERDMVAVTWLQRLPLPRLSAARFTDRTQRLIEWCDRMFVATHLFDATSEIGIPTVYCVQEAPNDAVAGRLVSACTKPELGAAAEGAVEEVISLRPSMYAAARSWPDVDLVMRGALSIGGPELPHALDFLLRPDRRLPGPPPVDTFTSPTAPLPEILDRCERAGHRVYAVDLTTPELRLIGLRVARVVLPSLQPLTWSPYAKYLGHPRLYQLPLLLGHRSLAEEQLNDDPQPFA